MRAMQRARGFRFAALLIRLSAACSRALLPDAEPRQERHAAAAEPRLLRLGRTGGRGGDAGLDRHELARSGAGRATSERARPKVRAGAADLRESQRTRLLQVR